MADKYQLYPQITGWKQGGEEFKNAEGRAIKYIVLGEIYLDNDSDYITEEMYSDILALVRRKKKNYKVEEAPKRIPQMLITNNGHIVIHNDHISGYIKTVQDILKSIPVKIILNGYKELRLNSEKNVKLTSRTASLVNMINAEAGIEFTNSFIYAVIKEQLEETKFSTNGSDVKMYIRTLSYEEILNLCIECLYFKQLQVINDEFIMECINESSLKIDDLQTILNKEMMCRLVTGAFNKGKTEVNA